MRCLDIKRLHTHIQRVELANHTIRTYGNAKGIFNHKTIVYRRYVLSLTAPNIFRHFMRADILTSSQISAQSKHTTTNIRLVGGTNHGDTLIVGLPVL